MESERCPAGSDEEGSASRPAADADSGAEFELPGVAAPEALDAWVGRVIDGRYRIVKLLGQGGMGAVFVAEHLTLRKAVAFKVMRAELSQHPDFAARFVREAMATARFEHPHIASAIDFGTLPQGGAYLVIQLVGGQSVRRMLLAESRLPWRRMCEIAAQVADALAAARASGIVHRDLKPDNILVERREDGSDWVKVLDFGIAHVTDANAVGTAAAASELTRKGTVIGTLGYMSPEQAVGDPIDHRSDLYALGVVLWEAIAGRRLWAGPSFVEVVRQQLSERAPSLRAMGIDASLPPKLDALIARLTARLPADRPEHAVAVRDALRQLAQRPASMAVLPWLRMRVRVGGHAALVARAWQPLVRSASNATAALGRRYCALQLRTRVIGLGALALTLATLAVVHLRDQGGDAPDDAPSTLAASRKRDEEPSTWKQVLSKLAKEPAIPAALTGPAKVLAVSDTGRERRAAADAIANYSGPEQVPAYLRTSADFERARTCGARKEVIARIRAQPDARYIQPLERLNKRRNGCGFLGLSDCYACIRTELRRALDELRPLEHP